jgi:acetylornithine/succinyldiaminopimelate/putrescine aminotransferase
MSNGALLPIYERDLTLVRGKGTRLWDSEGREWLDFAAGIAVNGFGYGDRRITAAVLIEPVQGEGGIRPAPPEFLKRLASLCRERGALLVFDEIQCGLGRTGRMFAWQHSGVVPDMLALAKPLAGGLPMGALLLGTEHAGRLKVGDHGTTFGGNAVCAAAALAVLDHLEAEGFVEDVAARGEYLMRGLRKLARRHKGKLSEVRGLGLMVGVELAGEVKPVLAGLRDRGILATRAGERVLRLLPPLVVKRGEIRKLLAALDEVLAAVDQPAAAGAGAPGR